MGETLICPHCHKEFTPTSPTQRYCSKKCAEAEYNKQYKALRVERACVICGDLFIPKTRGHKTCGKEECKHRYVALYGKSHKCKYDVPTSPRKKKRGISNARWNSLSPSERWKRMTFDELSLECVKYHISYGKAQTMYYCGTLPIDFGKR